jgi:hypothetical protein
MADEKSIENLPDDQNSVKPEPIAEDLSDSELEEASGGAGTNAQELGTNSVCGFGC